MCEAREWRMIHKQVNSELHMCFQHDSRNVCCCGFEHTSLFSPPTVLVALAVENAKCFSSVGLHGQSVILARVWLTQYISLLTNMQRNGVSRKIREYLLYKVKGIQLLSKLLYFTPCEIQVTTRNILNPLDK